MVCAICQRPGPELYHFPAERWDGPVPPGAVCFFCYLRRAGARPPKSRLVPMPDGPPAGRP